MKKKVLIITYYWPPSGGSGVQRWIKFVKYLQDFGWEPIVYTPENPEIPAIDHTLSEDIPDPIEVLKTPIREPYSFYKKILGKDRVGIGFMSEEKKSRFLEDIFKWIRGNLFIPDARKFWIKPSVRFLSTYLSQHTADAVVSTGPPHSMHLIALEISRRFQLPWLADFRDPWTNIDFYHDLKLTDWANRKHHRLERKVLTGADRVTVVSPTMKSEMEIISDRQVDLLTNGYDPDDFREKTDDFDTTFTILHTGTMVETRNPINLWRTLSELTDTNPGLKKDLEIKLVGKVDVTILDSLDQYGLKPYLTHKDYVPHQEVVQLQQKSRILLLVLNDTPNAKCLLPGKLFEYLAAGRPVICIGPKDGDVRNIMDTSDLYCLAGFGDTDNLKSFLANRYAAYQRGDLEKVTSRIEVFSRPKLTERLASILNDMTS